jgi:type IV fimbrial biogenesis protein FimT
MRKNSGFSLTEVMIVIAIMAIMAGITVPNLLSWLPKYRLRSAGDELYSNLQFTKVKAIKDNVNWAVIFNFAGNSYTIRSDTDSNGNGGTVEKTVSLESSGSGVSYGGSTTTAVANDVAASIPADGISYSSPSNIIVFTPRGMITNLGYVYLTNANSSMAVGTPTLAGVVVQRVWSGSAWE